MSESREHPCPDCQATMAIVLWRFTTEAQYAILFCADHGLWRV